MAGIMRFHKGAVKTTSTTENSMVSFLFSQYSKFIGTNAFHVSLIGFYFIQGLEVLHGSFEVWQGKQAIEVTPGLIILQPGTRKRSFYFASIQSDSQCIR